MGSPEESGKSITRMLADGMSAYQRVAGPPEGMRFEWRTEPMPVAEPWTDEQIELLKAEWERQQPGHPRLLTPLPRRVRVRLAAARVIDRTAIWLVDHDHHRAAIRLWRAFGMWRL